MFKSTLPMIFASTSPAIYASNLRAGSRTLPDFWDGRIIAKQYREHKQRDWNFIKPAPYHMISTCSPNFSSLYDWQDPDMCLTGLQKGQRRWIAQCKQVAPAKEREKESQSLVKEATFAEPIILGKHLKNNKLNYDKNFYSETMSLRLWSID